MRRMKAYARVAIQFLVAYAMVFQQMPVVAFAQQAVAAGDAEANQPTEQQEAAAPATEETRTAELPAAEGAQPLDESTSDGTSAAAEANGWAEFGTCLWSIDGDGVLTIKPKDESDGGALDCPDATNGDYPWSNETNSITAVKFEDKIEAAQSIAHLFSGCTNLKTIDFGGLDTSGTTNMEGLFSGCSSLTSLDLSLFDMSKVTNMDNMFDGCSQLEIIQISADFPAREQLLKLHEGTLKTWATKDGSTLCTSETNIAGTFYATENKQVDNNAEASAPVSTGTIALPTIENLTYNGQKRAPALTCRA